MAFGGKGGDVGVVECLLLLLFSFHLLCALVLEGRDNDWRLNVRLSHRIYVQ